MPTTITKTIGTGGTRDYTSIAAWLADTSAVPTNLVTSDVCCVADVYNDGEFTSATQLINVSGKTTDATHTITIQAAAGQSFRDNASVRSNSLAYNASNGVAFRCTGNYVTTASIGVGNVYLRGLQIQGANGNGTIALGINNVSGTVRAEDVILSGRSPLVATAGGSVAITVVNALLHARGAGGGDVMTNTGTTRFEFVTMVRDTAGGTGFDRRFGPFVAENCFFGNWTTPFTINTGTGGSDGGCNHNATDAASCPGTSNLTGLTYSSQVVNTASDWRAKSGGSLESAGVVATSYATDDISGRARPGTPTIGAWELGTATAGGPLAYLVRGTLQGGFTGLSGGLS